MSIASRLAMMVAVCLASVAAASFAPWSVAIARAGPRKASAAVPCGPSGASTKLVVGGMRIFRPENPNASTSVCSRSSRGSTKLGRGGVNGPFAIGSPWAAGVESKLLGVDSVKVSIVGVDVFTGGRVRCLIGGADRPGQLPKVERLWATHAGKLVVSATLRLSPQGPEIGICAPGGSSLEVIAQGETIEAGSIEVQGSVVRWTQDGVRQSKQI